MLSNIKQLITRNIIKIKDNNRMKNKFNEIYDYILLNEIATADEINLVCCINGSNIDSLNSIIYAKTGYHDLEQLKEMNY